MISADALYLLFGVLFLGVWLIVGQIVVAAEYS
jgi:hypothetical protein